MRASGGGATTLTLSVYSVTPLLGVNVALFGPLQNVGQLTYIASTHHDGAHFVPACSLLSPLAPSLSPPSPSLVILTF